MIKRFDCADAVTLLAPRVFLLYTNADNANYDDQDGTAPTRAQLIRSFHVTAESACKVEVGHALANRTDFTPVYPLVFGAATGGVAGRDFNVSPVELPLSATRLLAIRVSVPADDAALKVAGDVTMHRV